MLKLYRNQQLNCFTAEVFMCQHHTTGNGLGYWNLRLLCEGTMIDAFHWDRTEYPNRGYRENDWVLVGGRWITKSKKRFQIIQSTVVMRIAANDPLYTPYQQLEFDFGDSVTKIKNG